MEARKEKLLSHQQVQHKIKRLSLQILENNYQEPQLVIVGIKNKGYVLAQAIYHELSEVVEELKLDTSVQLSFVELDKSQPAQVKAQLAKDFPDARAASIVLVDDVLYTGKTLFYALEPFFSLPLEKLSTLVLVDREYRRYPVSADFTGYYLSTTLQDHVEVLLEGEETAVFLR